MFYFECSLVADMYGQLTLGGLDSLDMCRRFDLTETTHPVRPAAWTEDVLSVKVDETLARACGKFNAHHTTSLKVPLSILSKGDLEELDRQHTTGNIRLNKNMTHERQLEIVIAALLALHMETPCS